MRGCKQNDAHQASISNYVIDDVYCYAMSSCSCRYKAIASASIHMNRFHWDYLTAAKLSISPHENFWPKFLARSGRACLSLRLSSVLIAVPSGPESPNQEQPGAPLLRSGIARDAALALHWSWGLRFDGPFLKPKTGWWLLPVANIAMDYGR